MKQSIFFDLDGTLWDAMLPIMMSYNECMKINKLPYVFDAKKTSSFMGLTPLETIKLAFPDVDIKEGERLFKLMFDYEIKYLAKHPGKLYPNEEKVISELSKSYDLYVVSNADKGYIENYLDGCKMRQYFKGTLCAGDTGLDKHDNIRLLMKKENIDEVIYVGDTLKDYIECQKAGVHFIHASYGFGMIEEQVDRINSLNELIPLINKIFTK